MRIRRKRMDFRTSTPARTGPHLADVVFGREGGGKWAPDALFGHTPAACLPNAPFSRQSPAQPRRGRPARALRRTPAGPLHHPESDLIWVCHEFFAVDEAPAPRLVLSTVPRGRCQ